VACKLILHPEKTKIVYCKDANRRGDFPNQSFGFLGFTFRARKTIWQGHIPAHGFMPAASPAALKAKAEFGAGRFITAATNPCKTWQRCTIRASAAGSTTSHFYHTQLRPTLTRIDAFLVRWARRKFKRLRHRTRGARDWFVQLRRATPTLFAHCQLCYGNGRTSGAV
jgi:RNA-directed DNA polymerase